MAAREDGLFVEFTSLANFTLTSSKSGLQLSGQAVNRIPHVRDYGIIPQTFAVTRSSTKRNLIQIRPQTRPQISGDDSNYKRTSGSRKGSEPGLRIARTITTCWGYKYTAGSNVG